MDKGFRKITLNELKILNNYTMKFLFKIVLLVVSNAIALYVADKLIPGFNINSGYVGFLEIGLVLGAINVFIRPILKLLSFPIIVLSFGLFSVIINIALLYITSNLFSFFTIDTLLAGILGLLVISIVNSFLINNFKK